MVAALKTIPDFVGFIRRILVLWEERAGGEAVTSESHVAALPLIHGYVTHVVELSRAVLVLYGSDLALTALPNIRLSMECAMTASWLSLRPDRTNRLIYRGANERRKALDEIVKHGRPGFEESRDRILDLLQRLESEKDPNGTTMQARFTDLEGGAELYTDWRAASELSHPSVGLADRYLIATDDGQSNPAGVRLRRPGEFGPATATAWLAVQASVLVVALTAYDSVLAKPRMKSQLARLAKQLGIAAELRLADTAAEPDQPAS